MRIEVLGCDGGIGGALRTCALLVNDNVLIDAGTGLGDLRRLARYHPRQFSTDPFRRRDGVG